MWKGSIHPSLCWAERGTRNLDLSTIDAKPEAAYFSVAGNREWREEPKRHPAERSSNLYSEVVL